jgi:hypothetical protein
MNHDVFGSIALLIALPYIIGPPIALVWVLTACAVRYVTGWKGLLPADVWHTPGKGDPWQ